MPYAVPYSVSDSQLSGFRRIANHIDDFVALFVC